MRRTTLFTLTLLLVSTLSIGSQVTPAAALTGLPSGFVEEQPITGLSSPTAFDWTPDGRMFVAEKNGTLRLVKQGRLQSSPVLTLPVNNAIERGLLGVAVDPRFPTSPYIYLFYTAGPGSRNFTTVVNRISRFEIAGDTVNRDSERILVDGIATNERAFHNAGDLHFGPDGMLYASTGDGADERRSPRLDSLNGKILRVDPATGAGAAGNPFHTNGANPTTDRIWAYGLRNPYRFGLDPVSGTIYIGDVGGNKYEELDEGRPGANYGWPEVEGPDPPGERGVTYPLFWYGRDNNPDRSFDRCRTIIGGDFVTGANFPASYVGDFFFADAACDRIWSMDRGNPGSIRLFASEVGRPVHLAFSPEGVLYWSDFGDGQGDGQIRRVRHTVGNRQPTARSSANPLTGPIPLEVAFSSAGSSDPDGDAISYSWDFGDGTSSTEANPRHTYIRAGRFEVVLTVRDSRGASVTAAPLTIVSENHLPVPRITAPADGTRLHIDEMITLRGSATDAEDGTIPDANLSWDVYWVHGTVPIHKHPYAERKPGPTLDVKMLAPEDLATANTSYLEVTLTATDSAETKGRTTIRILPQTTVLTFRTQPEGLNVVLDGETYRTGLTATEPFTITSAKGYKFRVGSFFQTSGDCQGYELERWSVPIDAEGRMTTPEADSTITAFFRPVEAHCTFLPLVEQRGTADYYFGNSR